ncbi:hybrid sensor histidine kinase/response regulator [Thiohalorhabdus sp.]|uniref:hybrid sensor histidine kinase/response regulator n=1 Tax=Thiohalorhabdus sp. TaxID=3094134 RepID=UPI002FC35D65
MSSGFDFSAFITGFQEEAEERLQAIESTLVELEKGRMDAEQLEKLRRDAHSVKGSANMLQLRDIGESAHVLEDTFAYLRDGTVVPGQGHIDFMFELMDGLRGRIQQADDPEAPQLDPEDQRHRLENLHSPGSPETGGDLPVDTEGPGEEAADTTPEPPTPDPEQPALEAEGPGAEPESGESAQQGAEGEIPSGLGGEEALDPDPQLGVPDGDGAMGSGEEERARGDAAPEEPPVPPELDHELGRGPRKADAEAKIANLQEQGEPVLDRLDSVLANQEGGEGVAAELESVAGSFEDSELTDAAEALKLVATVLGSPMAEELPASLRDLLQGLVDRVRKRLAEADQSDARPLDRERIRQAWGLLDRFGMIPDQEEPEPQGRQSTPEDKPVSPLAPAASDALGPNTDSEGPGEAEGLEDRQSPARSTAQDQASRFSENGSSVGGAEGLDTESPAREGGEAFASDPEPTGFQTEEPPAVATGESTPKQKQQRSESGGSEMDVSAFLDGFQAEARENLTVIQDGLLQAEQGQVSGETLDQMAQRAHSLKGSANMLGLNDLGEGAQVLEDGLGYLRSGSLDKAGIEALFGLHDALSDSADQVQEAERPRIDAGYWKGKLEAAEPESTQQTGSPSAAPPRTESKGSGGAPDSGASDSRRTGPKGGEAQSRTVEGTDKRKSASGQASLRVSAERLERLSDGVVGLAMDRATQEDRREELDKIETDFHQLRRQWEWFENILPETGPLVAQRDKMSQQLAQLNHAISQFRQETEYDVSARHALYDQIHQRVMDLQVSPLSTIFSVLPRSARDLAQRFQKRVELHIEGSDIELERKNVDALLEPLVHLVTNSISHGIEDPEEREAAGKDPVGHIWVTADHVGGEVAIKVHDDGRGIDYEKVRETAIRTGVTTANEAENMLPYDLLQMLFRPGFSTKDEVSQISGRGIGMDAVREAVQRMTGSIQVDSEVGSGTSFTLNIPVSTAVQRVLKFRVEGEVFGVLANQVERIMALNQAGLTERRGQRIFEFEGSQVPATWLSELFNLGEGAIEDARSLRLVVVRHLEGHIGLVVNEVMEETQAVVKDVTNYLRRRAIQGLIGTTIAGSGEVQLLLEPTGIKEMERTAPLTLQAEEGEGGVGLHGLKVLLVEDSPLARQMEKAVLENAGMDVDTAVDGLDALDRMEVRLPEVVISDVEMPRMDGYDLVRKLRDDNRYRGVPVFMVTSRDSQEDRDTAQKLGADGFLNKMDLQSGNLIEEIQDRLEKLYA